MNKYCLLAYILFFGISLQGQSLIGVNVDDLSDTQILSIFQKGEEQGLSIQDGEAMALNMGLSSGEAKKFKSRLEVLNSSTKEFAQTNNFNPLSKYGLCDAVIIIPILAFIDFVNIAKPFVGKGPSV